MSSSLDKALAAIGVATSLVSELRTEEGGDRGETKVQDGVEAARGGARPPKGTDQLRGLLEQLSGVLWVTKFWKTTNRDVAHFVPHDLLAGDPEDPVALS